MKPLSVRDRYEHQIGSEYDGGMRKYRIYDELDVLYSDRLDIERERQWHAERVRRFYGQPIPVLEPEPEPQYEENPVEARARALGLKIQRPHKE